MSFCLPENKKPLGIYIHIPFCIRKCKYCDFLSRPVGPAGVSNKEARAYTDGILREIRKAGAVYGKSHYVDTVYFGGGTPSLFEPIFLEKMLSEVKKNFQALENSEISMELNPGTVTEEKLFCYVKAGVNRFSFGVQSFDDNILQALGRIHDSYKVKETMDLFSKVKDAAAKSGKKISKSIDLIFGAPGEDLDIWKKDIEKAVSVSPEHISFYSLQLEEGTPLYEDYRYGKLVLPSWAENRKMYHYAVQSLKEAGYVHYEISNAAFKGYECRHNLKYWNMNEYLGFGEGACSFVSGKRSGEDAPDMKGDFVFTELRLIEGFLLSDYEKLFGTSFKEDYKEPFSDLKRNGFLTEEKGRVRFTEKGLDFTNPVMEKLLNYTPKGPR